MAVTNRIDQLQGSDFQEFCSVLLSAHDPSFQAVNGAGGDCGNDGFTLSGGTVFQAYAPQVISLGKLKAKVDETLMQVRGLVLPAGQSVTKLVLLTPKDLTTEQHRYLQERVTAAGLTAESWGFSRLLALLTQHPHVKDELPQLLVPDLARAMADLKAEVRRIADAASGGGILPVTFAREPDIYVLQRNKDVPTGNHRSFRYFRLTVTAPGLGRSTFEPDDEDRLLDLVRAHFWDERGAELESAERSGSRVAIEHRHPDLRFHTRWRWYGEGHFVVAGTLEDLHRPGTYSSADLALQILRGLRVASELGEGSALVRFTMDPHNLEVTTDPSDPRARTRLGARLMGIESISRPKLEGETRARGWQVPCELAELSNTAHLVAGQLIVQVLRDFHAARVRSQPLQQSVLEVAELGLRADAL